MTQFAVSNAPRRRLFSLDASRGTGQLAALEWGPTHGCHDLLFLHANGFNAMTYRQLLAPLGEAGLRVLAIDLRGHGLSSLPAQPNAALDWSAYRDDLIALCRLLAAEDGVPRVLAGHSMGGATCLLATLAWPADLGTARPLVLFDPVVAPPLEPGADTTAPSMLVAGALRRKNHFAHPEAAVESYQGRGAFKTWPLEVIRDYVVDGLAPGEDDAWHLRCAPEWEAHNFRCPFRPAGEPIAQLPVAMTVLRAAEGSTCRWEDWPPQAQVSTVPDSSHFIPMEFPELSRQVLQSAIAVERAAVTAP